MAGMAQKFGDQRAAKSFLFKRDGTAPFLKELYR